MRPDYYRILNVSADANHRQIHAAWRALARTHHPDSRSPGAPADLPMALLNEAWATLGNPARRKRYDLERVVLESDDVQELILMAAMGVLSGRGWTALDGPHREVVFVNRDSRITVRSEKLVVSPVLASWLPRAAVRSRSARVDCAVLVACRVLVPEETWSRLASVRFPAVVIDLIESRVFGEFPDLPTRELFRPLLAGEF